MVGLTKGTKENIVVDVTDRLSGLTTLDGSNPTFDIRWKNSDTYIVQDDPVTNIGMRAYCLVDTSGSDWKVGTYELFINFNALPEEPRIGPLEFEVAHGTSADLPAGGGGGGGGGGSSLVTESSYVSGSFLNAIGGRASWDILDAGTELLDVTDPLQPIAIKAGLYTIVAEVLATDMAPGEEIHVELIMDYGNDNATIENIGFADSLNSAIVMVCGTYVLAAGDAIRLIVNTTTATQFNLKNALISRVGPA